MPSAPRNGVILAAALVLVGGATAGIAWWYNLSRTHQALAFWGPPAVALIRDAPRVGAYQLDFEDAAKETDVSRNLVHPDTNAPANVLKARDISGAKGLLHLRHALLDDRSFAWKERRDDAGHVAWALTFEDGEERLVVYFSSDFTTLATIRPEGARRRDGEADSSISTRPIAAGLSEYFADVFQ